MKKSLEKSMKQNRRGRPKKKPGYDRQAEIEELISTAVFLFGEPYDDRMERADNAPTLEAVAEEMGITPVKVRKLLITADYYSTETSRKIQSMYKNGSSVKAIEKEVGIGKASVYSYLPYLKGAYNLQKPTLYAEQGRRYRERMKISRELNIHRDLPDEMEYFWKAVAAFEGYGFMSGGERFKYTVCKEDGIVLSIGVEISRNTVEQVYRRFRTEDAVSERKNPDKTPGSMKSIKVEDYLYCILDRLAVGW